MPLYNANPQSSDIYIYILYEHICAEPLAYNIIWKQNDLYDMAYTWTHLNAHTSSKRGRMDLESFSPADTIGLFSVIFFVDAHLWRQLKPNKKLHSIRVATTMESSAAQNWFDCSLPITRILHTEFSEKNICILQFSRFFTSLAQRFVAYTYLHISNTI